MLVIFLGLNVEFRLIALFVFSLICIPFVFPFASCLAGELCFALLFVLPDLNGDLVKFELYNLLTDENIYALNVVDCTFTSNEVENRGGAIAINIVNKEPSNPIEINGCIFNENKAKDDEVDNEFGGAIYYSQKESSYSNKYKFTIINCEFNENEVSYYGGAICN